MGLTQLHLRSPPALGQALPCHVFEGPRCGGIVVSRVSRQHLRDSVSPPEKVSQESLHAQPHSQPHPPLSLPQAHHLTPIPWNWPCSPCPGPLGSPGGSVWASGDTHFCPFLCSPAPPSTLALSPLPLSCLSSIHLGTPTPCRLSAFQNSKSKPNLSRQARPPCSCSAPQTKSYNRALAPPQWCTRTPDRPSALEPQPLPPPGIHCSPH